MFSIFFYLTTLLLLLAECHPIISVWDVQRRDIKGPPICLEMTNETGSWKCVKTQPGHEFTWASRNHGRPVMLGLKSTSPVIKAAAGGDCPLVTSAVNSVCIHGSRPFMYAVWTGQACHEMIIVKQECLYVPAVCAGATSVQFELWVDNNVCSSTNVTIDIDYCRHVRWYDRLNSRCISYIPWMATVVIIILILTMAFTIKRVCLPNMHLSYLWHRKRVRHLPNSQQTTATQREIDRYCTNESDLSGTQVVEQPQVTVNVNANSGSAMGQPYVASEPRGWTRLCILAFLPLMLIADAASCSNPYAVQGQLIECEDHADYEDCSIIFQTELSLFQLGVPTCLSVSDQNATVELTVGVQSFTSVFKPEYLYSTGWWQASIMTRRKCTGTSGCPSYYCNYADHDCSLGLDPDNVTGKACEWFCEVSGASPSCFTAYGCYRSSYNLDSDCAVDVYSLTPFSNEIRLNVNGVTQVLQESSYEDDQITVTLLGSLAGNDISVPSSAAFLCVDKATGISYFCDASFRQSPLRNKIGDIQCQSGSIVDWDRDILVRKYIHNQQTYMEFTKPGWSSDLTRVRLPADTSTVIWIYDTTAGMLKAVHKSLQSPVKVMVTSGSELHAIRSKSEVCPVIHEKWYGGCKFCSDGAYICVNASSSCYEGDAWLSANSVSLAVHLTTSKTEYCLPISGNESSIVLTLNTRKKAASCEFHPDLELKLTLINTTNMSNIDTWLNYQRRVIEDSSWMKYLLLIAFGIIIVCVVIFLGKLLLAWARKPKPD